MHLNMEFRRRLFSRNRRKRHILRSGTILTGESGQGLLEMALLTPILLLLALGVIELGRLAYFSIEVANAARAGAQYGSQSLVAASDNAGIISATQSDAPDLTLSAITPGRYCSCAGGATSTCASTDCPSPDHRLVYVQVNATGILNTLFNYPGIGASFTVSRQAVMRVGQ